MNRNYACTDAGQWHFQNGPQRVFVDLDYSPWIYFLDGLRNIVDQAGSPVSDLRGAWLDEEGNLLLLSERGIGLMCDRDLQSMSDDFRFADDAICDEESIAGLIEGGVVLPPRSIFLKWSGERIEIKTILRERVAGEFGFDPRPRAAGGDG